MLILNSKILGSVRSFIDQREALLKRDGLLVRFATYLIAPPYRVVNEAHMEKLLKKHVGQGQ